jgi:hypothetical protein
MERGELMLLDFWCVQESLTIGKTLFIGNRRREGKRLRQEMNRIAAKREAF